MKVGTGSHSCRATSDSLMRDPDWRASRMVDLVEYRWYGGYYNSLRLTQLTRTHNSHTHSHGLTPTHTHSHVDGGRTGAKF
jgi:hypothetical protein